MLLAAAFVAFVAILCVLASDRFFLGVSVGCLVLLPLGFMGLPLWYSRYMTPGVVLVAIMCIRAGFIFALHGADCEERYARSRGFSAVSNLALASATVLALSAAFADNSLSWTWFLTLCCVVFLPVLMGRYLDSGLQDHVIRILLIATVVVGILALLEYYFGFNPYSRLYDARVVDQNWSVARVRTSMGHPLPTMVIGSTGCVIGFVTYIRRGGVLPAVGCAMGALTVGLTASRTGVYAVATGIGLVVIVSLGRLLLSTGRFDAAVSSTGAKTRLWGICLAAPLILAALVFSPILRARSSSREGQISSEYRSQIVSNALAIFADHPVLGVGPGYAQTVYFDIYGNILENSALQLLVGSGLIGAIMFGLFVSSFVVWCLGDERLVFGASACTFWVAMSGYNALDSNTAILLLFGFLVVGAVSSDGEVG
ncbi:hypothetical protein CJJ17_23075, partial [Gordonia polyisoprenivorans]